MIIAVTILLIVAMICGTIIVVYYWKNVSTEVNRYTLNDVRNIEYEIRTDIKDIKNKLKEQKND